MRTFKEYLKEDKKPSVGKNGGFNYVVKIDALSSNDFYNQSFGRQLDDLRKVQAFQSSAKSTHVGAKGKATLQAVKDFIKDHNPSEYFAKWKQDASMYKDDSVEIWYK